MFLADRQVVLDAITKMGIACCSYSYADRWAPFCDCKYGVMNGKWPTAHESGNGCPELRSLYEIVSAIDDAEWARLRRRGNHTQSGAA